MQTVLLIPEPIHRILEDHWIMVIAEISVLTSIAVFVDMTMKQSCVTPATLTGSDVSRTIRRVRREIKFWVGRGIDRVRRR